MKIQTVSNANFGKKIVGDYSEIQKVSQSAGYPVKYIKKIDERIHQMFPDKDYKIKFVYSEKDVFDGCCGSHKVPHRKISVSKNGKELAYLDCNPKKAKDFVGFFTLEYKAGKRMTKDYCTQNALMGKRRLLMDYFSALCKYAKTLR